jgi:hypothetical protein
MNQSDTLNHFIKLFRYLILASISLFILSLILWPYLDLETWFLIVLIANSMILSLWIFYIHPIYSIYIDAKIEFNQFYNPNINKNEINNHISRINTLMKKLEELLIPHQNSGLCSKYFILFFVFKQLKHVLKRKS